MEGRRAIIEKTKRWIMPESEPALPVAGGTRLALVEVNPEVLVAALHFPAGTRIRGAGQHTERGMVVLIVEHEDLPEYHEGTPPPTITPSYTLRNRGEVSQVVFVCWGLPNTADPLSVNDTAAGG